MTEFDKIRSEGRLAFECIRGSRLYNLNTPTSDIDTGGVYLCTQEDLYGITGYRAQVSDHRHDNTWFEIGELVRLLLKSNPTVLETLFIPESKVIGSVHPAMQLLIENRDQFVSKQCFNPFWGYAKSQIEKARGLNKKIVNPIEKRLSLMDFVYTFKGQGSQRFEKWLSERGLEQQFCGLVNVPNMRDCHGVYYDFGQHCSKVPNWKTSKAFVDFAQAFYNIQDGEECQSFLEGLKPIGYRGLVSEDEDASALRLSAIDKRTDRPICFVAYNPGAYSQHCRMYREYQMWIKERNPERYLSNLNKTYDSKNMMHMFRLIHMASEIAEGQGLILERTHDREFLLDVRAHKFEYEELMELLQAETDKMNRAMQNSNIREKVDIDFANDILIEIRRMQFGG